MGAGAVGRMAMDLGWPGPLLRADGTPLTLTVRCRDKRAGGRGHKHPVTLTPDWRLETGHDLELERIAAAMGGYLSCLELADRVLPAAYDLWLAANRRLPPAVVSDDRFDIGQWSLATPAPGCSCHRVRWPEAAQAVEHLSSAAHWAWVHRAPIQHLTSFSETLERATQTTDEAPWRSLATRMVRELDGLERLWQVGIPRSVVETIHARVSPDGEPMPAALYRDVVLRGCDPDWLAQFSALGAQSVGWAARTCNLRDLVDVTERRRWLQAGAHPHDVADVLLGRRTLAEVREIARATGADVRRVTAVCAAWHRIGAHPDPDDVAFLVRHDHVAAPRFGRDVVAGLVLRFRTRPDPPSHTQAALVLALSGTVRIAETLLDHGVRSLSAADAIL